MRLQRGYQRFELFPRDFSFSELMPRGKGLLDEPSRVVGSSRRPPAARLKTWFVEVIELLSRAG